MTTLSETAGQLLFWSSATVALFAQTMVLRAAFAGRTPAASQTSAARAREAVWILLPALMLVVLLWFTWRAVPQSADGGAAPVSARSATRQSLRSGWSA